MRYQNWDVLLFPGISKTPIQEFKTTCHVIQDSVSEHLPMQGTLLLLPTVTSFIPALEHGMPFRLSIHSWETPEPSRVTKNYTKHADLIMFEARVFIDGRIAGYRYFGRDDTWPVILETGITVDKNGEAESLAFPAFHQELLTQNYWNAGDELGRIKVVIAEGFPRDSTTMPFERVKNVIAFSFQHAPLDLLETSSIAWPNLSMWRQVSFAPGAIPGVNIPRKSSGSGIEMHSHSPRRRSASLVRPQPPPPVMGMMLPPGLPSSRSSHYDPFTEPRNALWRQPSSADVSMPDYSSCVSQASQSRQFTDPIAADKPERRFQSMQSIGAFEGLCEALQPVNEFQKGDKQYPDDVIVVKRKTSQITDDYRSVKAGGSQTMQASAPGPAVPGGVKSRKENVQDSPFTRENVSEGNSLMANASQPSSAVGHKRQRVVTPAALKAIDQEDEPKNASIMRKTSQGSTLQENKEVGRRALGELPNVL